MTAIKNMLKSNFFKRSMMIWFISIPALSGCDRLLTVDLPPTSTSQKLIFTDEPAATSAVKGMYADMLVNESFVSGSASSAPYLAGLSCGELTNINSNPVYQSFENNQINSKNDFIAGIWSTAYNTIYKANAILEGLGASTTLAETTRQQLNGEALFVRAFAHFYLLNLFGDVPLIRETNYENNAKVTRTATSAVYDQIVKDLVTAEELIGETYQGIGKQRPNKATVQAFLARVYLYRSDWSNAAAMATRVIADPVYKVDPNLSNVFIAGSVEAIWQLALPVNTSSTTNEGQAFVIESPFDVVNVLTGDLVHSFKDTDARYKNWISRFNTNTGSVFFPYKYKAKHGPSPIDGLSESPEQSTVLRLAEQYLIRAEAYAHQGRVTEAIADLDTIRARAELPLIADTNPTISPGDLLDAIQQERQLELFLEGAHRWFDLKRTGKALSVLSALKPGITEVHLLWPVPENEFSRNPFLGNQNPGY